MTAECQIIYAQPLWQARRLLHAIDPAIPVERFGSLEQALRVRDHYDLLILDGPHSTAATLRISQESLLTVLPTGLALDDLEPSVLLAHELVKKGIDRSRLWFPSCRVGDSEVEITEARKYITEAGYQVFSSAIPERIAFRRASDNGRTLTETRFESLNNQADELAQQIINAVTKLTKERKLAHG